MIPATQPVVMVMGVSGAGKSTIGVGVAAALGAAYIEGDEHHPPGNVAKMRAGIPLVDADRWPWLDRLGAAVARAARDGPVVFACSGLKRAYRDRLRDRIGRFVLIYPEVPGPVIAARLAERRGHYMPPSLLQSQLDALEAPAPDEGAIRVDATAEPDRVVAEVLKRL